MLGENPKRKNRLHRIIATLANKVRQKICIEGLYITFGLMKTKLEMMQKGTANIEIKSVKVKKLKTKAIRTYIVIKTDNRIQTLRNV